MTESTSGRVGIVDDHPTLLIGAQMMLERLGKLSVVKTATTVASFLRDAPHMDLVLLDLQLQDGSSVSENVRLLHTKVAPVLIFTSGEDPELIREAARAGAVGMLRKSENLNNSTSAVLAAIRGEPIPSLEWASALESDGNFATVHLSKREIEVLRLYASGMTAVEVAHTLFVAETTVIDHVRRIRKKYIDADRPAPTKAHLALRAIEDQLL